MNIVTRIQIIDEEDTLTMSFEKPDIPKNSVGKEDTYVTPTGATVNSLTAIQTVYL